MTPERWAQVERLYHATRERAEADRAVFVAEACADDEALRREVESLLAQPASAAAFLGEPAIGIAAQLITNPDGTLLAGHRIGRYQLHSLLGAGGMGEVYRARDTKLGRDVAIKILPSFFTNHPDRLARFEREARMLAALNHPHIGAIYGFEDADGIHALVLELVEGQTLADRIDQGPIPQEEALKIAHQIADALESAHEKGIIHRDLKPANIKITPGGTVKVLDFGLAKAAIGSGVAPALSKSPTITVGGTHEGVILGTAAYMSPEQARGQPVDKRSDIWAFGCVLYEMLTGTRAFVGENVTDTLACIITTEPDWGALPAQTPTPIRRLLRRALAKDRNERLADIADARIELKDALTGTDARGVEAPPHRHVPVAPTLAAAAAIGVVAALAAGLAVWVGTRPIPSAPQRLSVVMLPDHPVAFSWIPGRSLAIAPDGTAVVYVARNPNAAPGGLPNHLELRSLLDRGARVLPKTEGAVQPFFSPDGRWVAFFTQGTTHELKKVSLAGGNPVTLLERIAGGQWGVGTWTDDGAIIFGTVAGGLQRIPADGGSPREATSLDAGEQSHRGAELVAGTRSVLFTVNFSEARASRIDAVMLDTGERRVIVDHGRSAHYLTSGHLLFQRGNEILIAPFDPKRLTITGPAVPFMEEVRLDGAASEGFTAQLAISRNGTLAYVPAVAANQTLGRVGRDGVFEPVGLAPSLFNLPRVSSTGQHIAFENWGGPQEIGVYVHDVVRGSTTKLSEEGENRWPAWHPDGKRVTFFSRLRNGIYLKELSGGERLLLSGDAVSGELQPGSWSPDGKALAFTVQKSGSRDIWILSIGADPPARPLLNSAAVEHSAKFSPDGQWLAYVTDESGRSEVYVRRYPDGEKLPVSTGGGIGPVWSTDGKEIFFQGAFESAERLMVVTVTPDRGTVRLGTPKRLLDMRVPTPSGTIEAYGRSNVWGPAYDIFPDGKQFVMIKGADAQGTREIVLVQNWFEELKRSGR